MRVAFAVVREMAAGRAWPIVALSAAAWVLIVARDHSILMPLLCSPNPADDWSGASAFVAAISINASAEWAFSWLVMLLAMMLPLVWQPLTHVWDRSLAERRRRAILLFLGGYLGMWMVAMTILALLAVALRLSLGSAILALAVAIGVAISWQMTSIKARFLKRCHVLRPLPAFGVAADVASFRYGVQIASPCIAACWAIMLLPLASDAAHIPIMAAAALLMLSERYY
jgi:predicted metal-binding membrane protein